MAISAGSQAHYNDTQHFLGTKAVAKKSKFKNYTVL
jgi:hypothetical protein